MLPTNAKTYFDSLSSQAAADVSINLARNVKAFERDEVAKGRALAGAGFAARLARVYADSLAAHAQSIEETLKTVHRSFNSPLDEGVDAQLQDWATDALSQAKKLLEDGYVDHLARRHVDSSNAQGFEHPSALASVKVANAISLHLWELRNVPIKQPGQRDNTPAAPVVINNSGTIGALQTGAGSTTNVHQQWINGDTTPLLEALASLRAELQRAADIDPVVRVDLFADIDGAAAELQQERPNKGRLLRWLGGISAVVQTAASIQAAIENVKAMARTVGLQL